jgi:hypothetical protein
LLNEAKTSDEKRRIEAVCTSEQQVLTSKLEELWSKELRHAFVIAVEKLMKTLHYVPKVEGVPKEDLAKMKKVLATQILRHHAQIFSAAG